MSDSDSLRLIGANHLAAQCIESARLSLWTQVINKTTDLDSVASEWRSLMNLLEPRQGGQERYLLNPCYPQFILSKSILCLKPFLIRQRVSLSTFSHLLKVSSAARSVSGHIIVQMNEASQEYEQDDGGLDSYERERHISALRESTSSLHGRLANRVQ